MYGIYEEMLGLKSMVEIKSYLSKNKENIKTSILNLQKILKQLYLLNTRKLNNKLIFIKKGVEKVDLAQRYILSLNLSFTPDNKDNAEIKEAIKSSLSSLKELERILESKGNSLRRNGNSLDVVNFRRDLDTLGLAYSCIRNLDTDMGLSEKDFDKNEIKDLGL